MSKITREEAKKCPLCGKETYSHKDSKGVVDFCVDLNCPYNSKTYQPPQLSDDVEELLSELEYEIDHQDVEKLRQHIQAQASEIEIYKQLHKGKTAQEVVLLATHLETFHMTGVIEAINQLNAIREVVEDLIDSYRSKNLYMDILPIINKIKQILEGDSE